MKNFLELAEDIWAEPDLEIKLWNEDDLEDRALYAFFPKEKKSDGAIIAIPGGAYSGLSTFESIGFGNFFSRCGITVFALSYSVAPSRFPTQLLEARRAVRIVRANAEKFGINPDKIAVMGSSAGGHLAAMLSTYSKSVEDENQDEIDDVSCIPNAQILCYPVICSPSFSDICHFRSYANLLGGRNKALEKEIDPCFNITSATPPAFIWHTSEDKSVNVINSYQYASALRHADIPVELHVFPYGHHGLGISIDIPHVQQWTDFCLNWLKMLGWFEL